MDVFSFIFAAVYLGGAALLLIRAAIAMPLGTLCFLCTFGFLMWGGRKIKNCIKRSIAEQTIKDMQARYGYSDEVKAQVRVLLKQQGQL